MKGKFENEIAEYLYALSLDGMGEEEGSVDENGWYTRISFTAEQATRVNDMLLDENQHGRCVYFDEPRDAENPKILCTGYWGAILHEDSQGFVDVTLLETSMEADEQWHAILHSLAVA